MLKIFFKKKTIFFLFLKTVFSLVVYLPESKKGISTRPSILLKWDYENNQQKGHVYLILRQKENKTTRQIQHIGSLCVEAKQENWIPDEKLEENVLYYILISKNPDSNIGSEETDDEGGASKCFIIKKGRLYVNVSDELFYEENKTTKTETETRTESHEFTQKKKTFFYLFFIFLYIYY